MRATARRLTPVWGVHSVVLEHEIADEASMTELACDAALALWHSIEGAFDGRYLVCEMPIP
jgi:hypothetical protein